MATRNITPPDRTVGFLAWVYQFERDLLAKNFPVGGDGYRLPPCWRPGHPVWRKLATFARNHRIDPARYVRWSLDVPQVGYPPEVPEPNRLLERARMERYAADRPKVRGRIAAKFALEKREARTMILCRQGAHGDEPAVANLFTVTTSSLDLSPLFRFALARSIGGDRMMRVAGKYEDEALFQFSRDPDEYGAAYDSDDALPDGFAEKAARFYAQIIAQHARGVAEGVKS
ncbi:hypothetical protein [Gemmata sp.]|uniref:hypothetical protein n=1 Tax=Gemmata sp. TaxID=1914242 RepID=UPI003F71FDCA